MKYRIYILFLCGINFWQPFICNIKDNNKDLQRYIWAHYKHKDGKLEESEQWYKELLENKNSSVHSYKGYLSLLRDKGNFKKVVSLIPKLEKLQTFIDEPLTQLIFVQALEKVGRRDDAIKRLLKANKKHKNNQELTFHTINLYRSRKELKNALITIDDFLEDSPNRPNNYIFYFIKSQILTELDQKEKALNEVKQCVELRPNFDKAWLLHALLNEKNKNLKEALKSYVTFLEINGGNKQVEQHVIHLILKNNTHNQRQKIVSVSTNALKNVYNLFKQHRYNEAIKYLQEQLISKHNTIDTLKEIEYKVNRRDLQRTVKCALKNFDYTIASYQPDFISCHILTTKNLKMR